MKKPAFSGRVRVSGSPVRDGKTDVFGGAEGDRTPDLCIANASLSQLSYGPKNRIMGRWGWVLALWWP